MDDARIWFVTDVDPFTYDGPVEEFEEIRTPRMDRDAYYSGTPNPNFDPTYNAYGTEVTNIDLYLQASRTTQNAMIDAGTDIALVGVCAVTIALIGSLIFYAFSRFWKKYQITKVSDPMGFYLIKFSRIWTVILALFIIAGIGLATIPIIASKVDAAAYYSSQMGRFESGKAAWKATKEHDIFQLVIYPD
ncbi:MAG: hypothetical protein KH704_01580 [Clostridiales bacterium]|nr:hypothetical protein [Clostridiales bacterium]